jgi:hypothetical protein
LIKNHPIQDACAILVLESLKVGRTSIRVNTVTVSSVQQSTEQIIQLTSSSLNQLQSNELQIGSYSGLKSYKNQLTLAKDSSIVVTLFDGPLFSSLSSSVKQADQPIPKVASSTFSYDSSAEISDTSLVQVNSLDSDYQLNRYSYRVKCTGLSEESVNVRFLVSHRKSLFNKCPVRFDYQIKVRCAQPHSLELAQLFVKNEENTQSLYSNLKWKCPVKLSSNLIMANLDRQLYVQLLVRDSLKNFFDNFTSHHVEWQIEKKHLLDIPKTSTNIKSLQLAANDENSLVILPNDLELDTLNSNLVFYQGRLKDQK